MVEHLNLLLKRAHSGGQSLATLGTLSLSLDLFLELDRTFSAQLDLEHSGTHKRPDNHVDVLALAKAIAAPTPDPKTFTFLDLMQLGWERRDWVTKKIQKGYATYDDKATYDEFDYMLDDSQWE